MLLTVKLKLRGQLFLLLVLIYFGKTGQIKPRVKSKQNKKKLFLTHQKYFIRSGRKVPKEICACIKMYRKNAFNKL